MKSGKSRSPEVQNQEVRFAEVSPEMVVLHDVPRSVAGRRRAVRGWLLPAALAVGWSALLAASASGQAQAVEEAFKQGALAMRSGRTADAERSFRQTVKLAPAMADAHLDLGLVLGREGKIDEAIAELRRALQLDPKAPSAHMFLGIFLYQTNQVDEARRDLAEELRQQPDNIETLEWMGMLELSSGHADRAVGPLDRAAELDPKNLDVLEYRAKAHRIVAEESYAQMARIDPNSWRVHKVRAELLAGEGRASESIAEYEAAVKLQAGNAELWEGLGDEYRVRNELEKARSAYTRELDLSPGNPIAMYNLGSTEIGLGDAAAGVPLVQAMLEVYRTSPVAEYYLGRGLATLGRDDQARAEFEKSIAQAPAGESAKRSWYELTRLYRKLGRTDDAQKALAKYTAMRGATEGAADAEREAGNWQKLGSEGASSAGALSPSGAVGP